MAGTFGKLRNFITDKLDQISVPASLTTPRPSQAAVNKQGDASLDPHPTVGFKVTFNPATYKLVVHVIGARHLPASVGHIPAVGYLVKVKLYPGKDKYETDTKPESWPTYNTQFDFQIPPTNNNTRDKSPPIETVLTTSKFLTLTIFAVDKLQKRKSVGSATWPLDHKLFAVSRKYAANNGVLETAELWKRVMDLSSGVNTLNSSQQKRILLRAKDQLEITLHHMRREAGEDDLLQLRVNRLRWGIDKAKEYQHKDAEMYVKLSVTNCFGQVMRCQKTSSFSPSISVAWPKDDIKAALEVSVPPLGPRNKGYNCVITLCAKVGKAGKKVHLGRVQIHQTYDQPDSESDHWTTAMQSPDAAITQWHNLICDPS